MMGLSPSSEAVITARSCHQNAQTQASLTSRFMEPQIPSVEWVAAIQRDSHPPDGDHSPAA